MFLSNKTNNVEDFLKALNFIAPEGTNLKYFVVPVNAGPDGQMSVNGFNGFNQVASDAGYDPLPNDNQIPGVTDTITYCKRDVKGRQSISRPSYDVTATPDAFPITKSIEVPMQANKDENGQMKTDILVAGGQVLPKAHGIKVMESTDRFVDIMLEESSVGMFPKNTLFHFVKESLNG